MRAHTTGDLIRAAAHYLDGALFADGKGPGRMSHVVGIREVRATVQGITVGTLWPWPYDNATLGEFDPRRQAPIRCLEKAGALVAAEIDRRLRAGEK